MYRKMFVSVLIIVILAFLTIGYQLWHLISLKCERDNLQQQVFQQEQIIQDILDYAFWGPHVDSDDPDLDKSRSEYVKAALLEPLQRREAIMVMFNEAETSYENQCRRIIHALVTSSCYEHIVGDLFQGDLPSQKAMDLQVRRIAGDVNCPAIPDDAFWQIDGYFTSMAMLLQGQCPE